MEYVIDFADGQSCTLHFDAGSHRYELPNGDVIPSTTQVLNIIAKPALVYWAASEGAKFFKENMIEVDEAIWGKLGGAPLYSFGSLSYDDMVVGIAKAHSRAASKAAGIGTTVHSYVEKFIRSTLHGEPTPDIPENKKAQKSIEAFYKWLDTSDVVWLSTEERLFHPELKYAGTVDAVAEVDGEFCVIDFKTSAKIYPEHKIQCAAYAKVVELIYGRKVDCTYVLRFDKNNGKFQVGSSDSIEEDFLAFRAALVLNKRLKR